MEHNSNFPASPVPPPSYFTPVNSSSPSFNRNRATTEGSLSSTDVEELDIEVRYVGGWNQPAPRAGPLRGSSQQFFRSPPQGQASHYPGMTRIPQDHHQAQDMGRLMDSVGRMSLSSSPNQASVRNRENIPPVLHRIRFETADAATAPTTRTQPPRHRRNLTQVVTWMSSK